MEKYIISGKARFVVLCISLLFTLNELSALFLLDLVTVVLSSHMDCYFPR